MKLSAKCTVYPGRKWSWKSVSIYNNTTSYNTQRHGLICNYTVRVATTATSIDLSQGCGYTVPLIDLSQGCGYTVTYHRGVATLSPITGVWLHCHLSQGCGYTVPLIDLSQGCGYTVPLIDLSQGCGYTVTLIDLSQGCGYTVPLIDLSQGCAESLQQRRPFPVGT